MAINKLTRIEMILTCAEMTVITIALLVTLFISIRDFRFRFILTLCTLLIITDVSTACLSIGLGLENSPIH